MYRANLRRCHLVAATFNCPQTCKAKHSDEINRKFFPLSSKMWKHVDNFNWTICLFVLILGIQIYIHIYKESSYL